MASGSANGAPIALGKAPGLFVVVRDSGAALTDHPGEHDAIAQASDLDDGGSEASVTNETGADTPAVFTAYVSGGTVVVASTHAVPYARWLTDIGLASLGTAVGIVA